MNDVFHIYTTGLPMTRNFVNFSDHLANCSRQSYLANGDDIEKLQENGFELFLSDTFFVSMTGVGKSTSINNMR